MNKGTVKLLEKHFDITFAAPDGIKKLRELILTLAMQGKLVEQDPQDQPARKLLQEIEAEKRRLVKEGKIKNPKPLPEIKADEVPYQLPEGWEWVRLRDICHDWGQKKPDERFTYIDVGSIDNKNGIIGETVQLLDSSEAPSRARKLVRKGTVIYSTVRPYLLNIAIIEKEYQQEPIASTAFAILHPYIGITNRFIYHYLHSPVFVYYVESTMKGVAYPAINDGDFFKGVFPLPPLPEQLRIVARIDQLMARCDELAKLRAEHEQKRLAVHTAALNRLLASKERDSFVEAWRFITRHFGQLYSVKENVAELRKAILQLAVMGKLVPQDPNDPPASSLLTEIEAEKQRLVKEGKIKMAKPLPEIKPGNVPYELPQNWEWMRLEDAVEISSGVTKGRKLNGKEMVALPYLRVANVQRGYLDLAVIKDIEIASDEIERFKIKKRDLLITEGGDWDKVGRTAIWNGEISQCIHQNHIFKARCLLAKQNEQWLEKYLNSSVARAYFADASKQTTNLASINKTQLRGCPVPLPPLPEQQRIVAKSDQLMALCDQLEQQIDAATEKQTALLNVVMAQV
jgi:type I restriction enzyme S subunit